MCSRSKVQSGADLALLERLEGPGLSLLSTCRSFGASGHRLSPGSSWIRKSDGNAMAARCGFRLGAPLLLALQLWHAPAIPGSTEGQIQNSEVVWDSAALHSHMAFS